MSAYGMLGLLEGAGKGMASMGEAMEKQSLLAAQEAKAMNLARVQREWATEDRDAEYDRQVARDDVNYTRDEAKDDKQFGRIQAQDDKQYGRLQGENDRDYNRRVAEQDKQRGIAKGERGDEFNYKLSQIDSAIKSGTLSPEEGAVAKKQLYGIGKKGLTEMDDNDRETQIQNLTDQLIQADSDLSFETARGRAQSMINGGRGNGVSANLPAPASGKTDNENFNTVYTEFKNIPEADRAAELNDLEANGQLELSKKLQRQWRDDENRRKAIEKSDAEEKQATAGLRQTVPVNAAMLAK